MIINKLEQDGKVRYRASLTRSRHIRSSRTADEQGSSAKAAMRRGAMSEAATFTYPALHSTPRWIVCSPPQRCRRSVGHRSELRLDRKRNQLLGTLLWQDIWHLGIFKREQQTHRVKSRYQLPKLVELVPIPT